MQAVTITQINPQELEAIIEKTLLRIIESAKSQKSAPPADEFLTIEEAASFLKLEKPTVYTLVSGSKIPYMKRGKRLYFSKDELSAWLREGRKKTISEIKVEL